MNRSDSPFITYNQLLKNFCSRLSMTDLSVLYDKYGINTKAKHANSLLINHLFADPTSGFPSPDSIKTFKIKFKTIKQNNYGELKESMSFPCFKYGELSLETWDQSQVRKYFQDNLFVFSVIKQSSNDRFIKGIFLWQMPTDVLESSVKATWEATKEAIISGRIVKYVSENGNCFTYFTNSSDNPHVHIRPHARNKDDTYPLPVPDRLTGATEYQKHCFWLNRNYLNRIIKENLI